MSTRPDDHRRKWDRSAYQKLAQDRIRNIQSNEQAAEKPKEILKQRDYKVDLDSKLGKSIVINNTTGSAQSGGYYCNVCDCLVKDSLNFLDHINGNKHQRNLGMSMKIERSTVEQVRDRFKTNAMKLKEKSVEYNLEKRLRDTEEEVENFRNQKRQRKADQKQKIKNDEDDNNDPVAEDIAAMMGFAGFGGSKKNN